MNRYKEKLVLIAILLPCIALVGWGRFVSPNSTASEAPATKVSAEKAAAEIRLVKVFDQQPLTDIHPTEISQKRTLAILREAANTPQAASHQGMKTDLEEEIRKLRRDLELAVDLLEKSFGKPVQLENIRSVPITITAYSSTVDQCDSTPHITASNKPVRHGVVAVSDDLIEEGLEFGQRVLIPGHGVFEVQDRMNSRWQRRVDIWQSDRKAALMFGKQEGTMLWLAEI